MLKSQILICHCEPRSNRSEAISFYKRIASSFVLAMTFWILGFGFWICPAYADNWISIGTGDIPNGSPVSNLTIIRAGNAPGSAVIVSWEVNPAGNVDIYTRTGIFTTEAIYWTIAQTNYSSTSWTDPNQVGMGTQKYYKIMPTGAAPTDTDLKTMVAGKFDKLFSAGTSEVMFSLPLIPSNSDYTLNTVIGSQLTGGWLSGQPDKIGTWNGSRWVEAYLNPNGTWEGTLNGCYPDAGYSATIAAGNPSKTVTFVGRISETNRSINLALASNLVGTCFPVPVSVNSSGIDTPLSSAGLDTISYWDGSQWISCTRGAIGFSGALTTFQPGNSYRATNAILSSPPNPDPWNYIKPY